MTPPNDDAPVPVAPVTLAARVIRQGGKFVAGVARLETADAQGEPVSIPVDGSGIGLEVIANTPGAAMDALTLTMRGWLERQDTADRLGEALGLDSLDDDAEIILRFVSGDGDDEDGRVSDANGEGVSG